MDFWITLKYSNLNMWIRVYWTYSNCRNANQAIPFANGRYWCSLSIRITSKLILTFLKIFKFEYEDLSIFIKDLIYNSSNIIPFSEMDIMAISIDQSYLYIFNMSQDYTFPIIFSYINYSNGNWVIWVICIMIIL